MSDVVKGSRQIQAYKRRSFTRKKRWTIQLGNESLDIINHKKEHVLSIRAKDAHSKITFNSAFSIYHAFEGSSKKVKLLLNDNDLAVLKSWICLSEMDPQVRDFWHTTWMVWRSGALSRIDDAYRQVASSSFDDFPMCCADVEARSIRVFLSEFSPLPGEFLISYDNRSGFWREPSFVLTNIRLVIRDRRKGRFEAVPLAEIKSFHASGSTATLRLVRQNGEELVFPKLGSYPSEDVLRMAIERARIGGSWEPQGIETSVFSAAEEIPIWSPTAKELNDFATAACKSISSIVLPGRRVMQLIEALTDAIQKEYPDLDSKDAFDHAKGGVSLSCPQCGHLGERAVPLMYLAGTGSMKGDSFTFGASNLVSLAEGRCPNCGGITVEATFDPRKLKTEKSKTTQEEDEAGEVLEKVTMKRQRFVAGYEIQTVVKCAKCHQEMYIPKGWADTPRSAGYGPARDGNRCLACGNYICETCMPLLQSYRFRCCEDLVKGVQAICYFSFSDAADSQQTDREQAPKGQPPIHVKHEERDEKRREWLDKAEELKKQGQYEKAFDYFDRIIRANLDTNGYARYLKGCALIELERHAEAAECLRDALKADPEGDMYRFDLGRVLYKLNRWKEARSVFEKIARGSNIYGLDKKAKEWIKKMETEKH